MLCGQVLASRNITRAGNGPPAFVTFFAKPRQNKRQIPPAAAAGVSFTNMYIILIILMFLTSMTLMADPELVPPKGMSQEEWKKHLDFDRKLELERKEKFEDELKNNPPEPPWVKYPEHSPNDLFWRMGKGETYIMENVHPYLEYATENALREYKKKYPEPNNWKGWYKN